MNLHGLQRLLHWTVTLCALALPAGVLFLAPAAPNWKAVLLFAILGGAAEMLRVYVYLPGKQGGYVSPSIAIVMAAAGFFGMAAAVPSALSAALVNLALARRWNVVRWGYHVGASVLGATIASWVLQILMLIPLGQPAFRLCIAGAVSAVVWYLVFCVLTDGRKFRVQGELSPRIFMARLLWFSPHQLLLGASGIFVAIIYRELGSSGALMIIIAVVLLRYTFEMYSHRYHEFTVALEEAKLDLESSHQAQQEMMNQLVETVSATLDARDSQVYGHSRQVAKYAVALGQELGFCSRELSTIRIAALLHDLGKVAIPELILHKPASLTPVEYQVIKEHALTGEKILGSAPALAEVARLVGEHHERWNGRGYPRGRKGCEISLGGRVLAVADALDTILSDRPYARGRPLSWALAELERCSGEQFDPTVVQAVNDVIQKHGHDFFSNSAYELDEPLLRVAGGRED